MSREDGKGGRVVYWEGGKNGRVVSWEGGKGGRVVSWKGGKGGRIVRQQGQRGWRAVTWEVGKDGRMVSWKGGKGARVVWWHGGKGGRVVKWKGGRFLVLFESGRRRVSPRFHLFFLMLISNGTKEQAIKSKYHKQDSLITTSKVFDFLLQIYIVKSSNFHFKAT